MTMIPAALWASYRRARYRVHLPGGGFDLCPGHPCPALLHMYRELTVAQAAFITACNPGSQLYSTEDNLHAQARLQRQIQAEGWPCLPGTGIDPDGTWPDEPSWLVLGIDAVAARALARSYGQLALLLCGADGIPHLTTA